MMGCPRIVCLCRRKPGLMLALLGSLSCLAIYYQDSVMVLTNRKLLVSMLIQNTSSIASSLFSFSLKKSSSAETNFTATEVPEAFITSAFSGKNNLFNTETQTRNISNINETASNKSGWHNGTASTSTTVFKERTRRQPHTNSDSRCVPGPSITNVTQCPDCIRSVVPKLVENFRLVDLENGKLNKSIAEHFKVQPLVVQPLSTKYLIEPHLNSSSYYLLAVQMSVLDRKDERDCVRKTWGSVAREQKWPNRKVNAPIKIIFVVATPKDSSLNETESKKLFQSVQSEAQEHNDILYIDMMDSYWNLTHKVLSAFRWVKDSCPCVRFVLKVDYDTFVNVPLLIDTLLYYQDFLEDSLLGNPYMHTRVIRRGKWAVSTTDYPQDTYVNYMSGCGYLMSYSVLARIVDLVPHVRTFPMEDVYITGVLRILLGFQLIDVAPLFTNNHERYWPHCLMFQDRKILGTSKNGGSRHYWVWGSFVKNWCK